MVETQHDSRIAQLRRGVLEFCVMALLEHEERYGFDLVRELATWEWMKTGAGPSIRCSLDSVKTASSRVGGTNPRVDHLAAIPPERSGRAALTRFRLEWVEFAGAVGDMLGGKS